MPISTSTSKTAAMDTNAASFEIFHADHGISEGQMACIQELLVEHALWNKRDNPEGFFIVEIRLPIARGVVPCALHGPACGDDPVHEDLVHYSNRGLDREWEDRMINRVSRSCSYVQVIGVREGNSFQVYTVYGGPLAPQHPDDPTNQDPDSARRFWAVHALADG